MKSGFRHDTVIWTFICYFLVESPYDSSFFVLFYIFVVPIHFSIFILTITHWLPFSFHLPQNPLCRLITNLRSLRWHLSRVHELNPQWAGSKGEPRMTPQTWDVFQDMRSFYAQRVRKRAAMKAKEQGRKLTAISIGPLFFAQKAEFCQGLLN